MPFPHEREEVTPNNDFLTVSDKSGQVLLVTQSFKGLFTTVRCVLNFGPISLQIVSANPNEVTWLGHSWLFMQNGSTFKIWKAILMLVLGCTDVFETEVKSKATELVKKKGSLHTYLRVFVNKKRTLLEMSRCRGMLRRKDTKCCRCSAHCTAKCCDAEAVQSKLVSSGVNTVKAGVKSHSLEPRWLPLELKLWPQWIKHRNKGCRCLQLALVENYFPVTAKLTIQLLPMGLYCPLVRRTSLLWIPAMSELSPGCQDPVQQGMGALDSNCLFSDVVCCLKHGVQMVSPAWFASDATERLLVRADSAEDLRGVTLRQKYRLLSLSAVWSSASLSCLVHRTGALPGLQWLASQKKV